MKYWSTKQKSKCWVILSIGVLLLVLSPPLKVNASIGGYLDLGLEYHRASKEFSLEGELNLVLASWARDDVHLQTGLNIRLDNTELSADIDEAKLTMYGDNTDWIVGWQKIIWGAVDNNSPVDNINPRDLTRPFAKDNKISVPAVRLRLYNPLELDAIWQPYATPNRMDLPGESVLPERTINNSMVGVRASRSTLSLDVAGSYIHGVSANPVPVNGSEDIQFKHYMQQIIGGEVVYDQGSFIFRGDIALIFPESAEYFPENHTRYAVTAEHTLTPDVMVLAGIQGEKFKDEKAKHVLMGALDYQVTFYTKLRTAIAYDLSKGSYFLTLKASHDLADGLEIRAGGYYFGGPEEGVYGPFKNQDHVFIGLTQAF